MGDLISRSALGIGKCKPEVFENKAYADGWNSAIAVIEKAPTVDAVEVVRCKDCKYCRSFKGLGAWCHRRFRAGIEYKVKSCDFCSYGERRDDYAFTRELSGVDEKHPG